VPSVLELIGQALSARGQIGRRVTVHPDPALPVPVDPAVLRPAAPDCCTLSMILGDARLQ
jgi:hypothetical protein